MVPLTSILTIFDASSNQLELFNTMVTIKEFFATFAYLCAAATAIVAALFAIYKFNISREAEAILELELTVENIRATNLFDVSIHIRNVGKAAAYVSTNHVKRAIIMVRKISCADNHPQLVWDRFEEQRLMNDIEYITPYGNNVSRTPTVSREAPTTSGWRTRFRAFYHLTTLLAFTNRVPGQIYGLVYSFIWYGQLSAKEYPMIYEPGCTMTHRVFFSTDYQGPIWIRVELFYEREYWLLQSTQRWEVCDRLFTLQRRDH